MLGGTSCSRIDQLLRDSRGERGRQRSHGHLALLDRGTRGEGLARGAVYRQTGAERNSCTSGRVGVNRRIQVTINLIGRGSAPNFLVHEILRVTVSPAGVVTLEFDKIGAACRG